MEQRMRYATRWWIHPLRSIFIRALTEALFCMRMMETDMHMSRVNITRFLLPGRMMSAALTIGAAEHTFAQGAEGT